jgi:hypothetical protein
MARGLSSWVVDGSSSVAHVIGHLADRKVQSWSGRTALSVDAWLPMSARFNIHSKLFKDEVEGVRPGRLTPVVQPPNFRVLYLWKETHFISYCLSINFMDDFHRRAERAKPDYSKRTSSRSTTRARSFSTKRRTQVLKSHQSQYMTRIVPAAMGIQSPPCPGAAGTEIANRKKKTIGKSVVKVRSRWKRSHEKTSHPPTPTMHVPCAKCSSQLRSVCENTVNGSKGSTAYPATYIAVQVAVAVKHACVNG